MSLADLILSLLRLIDPRLPTTIVLFSLVDLWKMLVVFVITAFAVLCVHELAHLAALRSLGIPARILLGGRREESRFWFLSPMVVHIEDQVMATMQPLQIRLAAASGPIAHLLASLACWCLGLSLPGPAWLGVGVTLCGAMYFVCCMLMNVVPLPVLKNDGWLVLRPETALAEVRRKLGLLD
ncbi:hypothetical protein [Cupriavidus sp. YAF13]|uniref:hypothetical protein n=1 Tax=Cupriavidus sp. YAF13 TaxID=3233075 RepID=UPI003F926FBF